MVRLMNSAMIPQQGVYYAKKVTEEEARKVFQERKSEGWVSYIGYPETAQYVSNVLKVEVPVSREQTVLENGDVMIVCRLKYRVQNPQEKGTLKPTNEDFEWYIVEYQA